MIPVTERDIRSSFINCSKGAATRLGVPRNLSDRPWEDLDFLGWRDPSSPARCYVVMPQSERLVGVALQAQTAGSDRTQMCAICLTSHPRGGVLLMAASKAGASGRQGNTVGTYLCADLACSLYARRKKTPALGLQFREDFDPTERAQLVRDHMSAFITKVSR